MGSVRRRTYRSSLLHSVAVSIKSLLGALPNERLSDMSLQFHRCSRIAYFLITKGRRMDMRNKSIYFSLSIAKGEEKAGVKLATHAKSMAGMTSRVAADLGASWRDEIIRLLKDSLISELVYVLCCSESARSSSKPSKIDAELVFHMQQELAYASSLAGHIARLEGEMACSPRALGQLSCVADEAPPDLQPVIDANLTDELVAILSYSRIIPLINEEDVETRQLLNEILSIEKEHAEQIKERLNNWRCK